MPFFTDQYSTYLYCIFFALCAAILYFFATRAIYGSFIKELVAKAAADPESALLFEEFSGGGRIKKFFLTRTVKGENIISCTREKKGKIDFSADRFYIAETNREKAIAYGIQRFNPWICLIMLAGAYALVWLIYYLLILVMPL